jgi:DNA-binding protein H-NS
VQSKKSSFASLSNEALCKLRDEITELLNSRAEDLRREADRLTAIANGGDVYRDGNGSKTERKKAAPKYRGPDGKAWSGRGLQPRWLSSAIKEGKKLEDFLIV